MGRGLAAPSSLNTSGHIWVGHAIRTHHTRLWLLILELVDKHKVKWRFLPSAEAWAVAKAKAIEQSRSATVLALVGSSGDVRDGNHVFDASAFLQFITRNETIGSLGMAGM